MISSCQEAEKEFCLPRVPGVFSGVHDTVCLPVRRIGQRGSATRAPHGRLYGWAKCAAFAVSLCPVFFLSSRPAGNLESDKLIGPGVSLGSCVVLQTSRYSVWVDAGSRATRHPFAVSAGETAVAEF